jgi:DNA-binding transcriptional ArsR family regulator
MEIRRDVFQAIADPTRREIIELVAKESLNLNAIADNFNMTRQAVSLHVKILSECGLIVIKQQGRERLCEAQLDQLNEVATWVEHCKKFWSQQFKQLDRYLKTVHPKKQKK